MNGRAVIESVEYAFRRDAERAYRLNGDQAMKDLCERAKGHYFTAVVPLETAWNRLPKSPEKFRAEDAGIEMMADGRIAKEDFISYYREIFRMAGAEPADGLDILRPDQMAECYNGVSRELGDVLWNAMRGEKPLSEVIDIEDSSPHDALGVSSISSLWHKFSDIERCQINAVAALNAPGRP